MSTDWLHNSSSESVRYTDLSVCSDDELMRQLQNANGDALAVLFKRYQRLVFSIAMKVLRDLGEAEDITQSAFMQVFHTAKLFDNNRGTAKIWILKHAYHLSLNRRRHLTVRKFYSAEEISELGELVPDLAPGDMTFPEKKRLVTQSLTAINGSQRRVLELAFYEGFTLKEIAEQMGESLTNVRHHYYRGLEKIRSYISSRGEDRCPVTSKEAFDAEA